MKKLLLLLAILVAVPAHADDRSKVALEQLAARMKAMGDYHAKFEISGEDSIVRGTYVVNGNRYRMNTRAYEVISDGTTRWEVNHPDKEVLVDREDSSTGNFFYNPTRAFDFAVDEFDISARDNGTITLRPRDPVSAVQYIEVRVSPATGLPTEWRYNQEDLQEIVVRIIDLQKGLPRGTTFSFDKARYKGYEVVDFR